MRPRRFDSTVKRVPKLRFEPVSFLILVCLYNELEGDYDPFRLPPTFEEMSNKQRLLHFESAGLILRSLPWVESYIKECPHLDVFEWNREMLQWILEEPNKQKVTEAIWNELNLINYCIDNDVPRYLARLRNEKGVLSYEKIEEYIRQRPQ